ncbi:MAG: phosphoribosylglycinamide formyltransferase [Elusimicrobia bacterium]|nr:phosphoribosylglycinamide formyltransferase [Elusimicrobiota bacterium]
MKFAVLASGNGSNLEAIIDALRKKKIKGTLQVVFSDKENAFALQRARKAQVPVVAWRDPKACKDRAAFDRALVKFLRQEGIELVVLAGYMRILSPVFVRAFRNRIINIHPALLPAFKGAHAIRDAFKAGVKVTGVTVHIVDEEVDHGPILAQAAVAVTPADTLASLEAKIHKVEHRLYPEVIGELVKGKKGDK